MATGLTQAEAALRLRREGPNLLPVPRGPSPWRLFVAQLTHFFAVMLWVAAGLAAAAGMPELAAAVVIVIVLNAVFAFAQEWRADRAAHAIAALMPMRATVRRDGRRRTVPAEELVVGDVVLLAGGDRISADIRLTEAASLSVDESALTGESRPARRSAGDAVVAGTFVVEGEAEGVVEATGAHTRLAGIAAATQAGHRPPSPLARGLDEVVRRIAGIAALTGVAFFAVGLFMQRPAGEAFVLALGVTVALVPEGLLPTVTLSLARAAQRMARQQALVRHLEAVETLGATTFVCTDKTGTLTRNEMTVVRVWTPYGEVRVQGAGYSPGGRLVGPAPARAAAATAALAATLASNGRVRRVGERWVPSGDPMEVALHVLALRADVDVDAQSARRPVLARFPFDPRRRRMSVVRDGEVLVKGAPDAVLPCCVSPPPQAHDASVRLASVGLRVLAVARRDLAVPDGPGAGVSVPSSADEAESHLELLALVGIEDPPREGVAEALADLRRAAVKVAMVTGDAGETARAIAAETGLLGPDGLVVLGADLPADDARLGELLDRDGVVVARVTPEDKQRIAAALQHRGHVVAMTGDGVNDGPALRAADVGVAMGRSGTDVAREAADLVLLDDHLATIVAAIASGRATFTNIRRFLTYHLTDNVAELTPFLAWGLSAGHVPLAIGVLQVLALDIGTDLLPALALGGEPPSPRVLDGPPRTRRLIDAALLRRAFGVLGPAEALVEMGAFWLVLAIGGWAWGGLPAPTLLATASGTAFAAVVLGQLANAFACRSETQWAGGVDPRSNPLLLGAVAVELGLLAVFLWVPVIARVLGGAPPPGVGWAAAAAAVPAVVGADAAFKRWHATRAVAVGT
jgi:magnesium-transporting ATPase (P-type)